MGTFGLLSGSVQNHRSTANELYVILSKRFKQFSRAKDHKQKIVEAIQILVSWGRYQQAFDDSRPDMYPGGRDDVEHEEVFLHVAEVSRFLASL